MSSQWQDYQVTMQRWDAAPEPEWVLMYQRGLSVGEIAKLVCAPARTVSYHLTQARKLQPELQAEHEQAVRVRPGKATTRGLHLMKQLIAMVRDTGRYPSRKSSDKTERALASWLYRRRQEYKDGTLMPAYRDGLSLLPGWQGTPRAFADEARWHERLAALAAYRAAGHDWPRHKTMLTGVERELGIWLHIQRYKERRGLLEVAKAAALDKAVTGWRTGRRRGRRPRPSK